MPNKNDRVTIEVTGMTHEGLGVGRLEDGMTVFLPMTAVGDLVDARIERVNKTHCYARAVEVVRPSPDRVQQDCPVFRRCGGCVFRHVSYQAELRYKQEFVEQNMRRIGGFQDWVCEPILPSPSIDGYRNKAQFPVRMQKDSLCAGFFAPRSHEVVACTGCRLQPPVFEQALEVVLAFARETGLPAYDEGTGEGMLRHVYLRRGERSHELMVCLVVNGQSVPREEELVRRLVEAVQPASVVLNVNTQNTNVILGDKNRLLHGKPVIEDTLAGVPVSLSPEAFYQVNVPAAEQLYAQARVYAGLTGGETVLDLYCGAGTIGLSMWPDAARLIGVELIPAAVENARENARRMGAQQARFFCADASEAAQRLANEGEHPDVVLLDPPRKGCDAACLEAVAQMAPKRVVYISCNSATLARDCKMLSDRGYKLERARPADLFARTAHVECVALLIRQ